MNTFVFRKHMSVGAPAAENDAAFLKHCFVNSGDIDVIKSADNAKCIVVGRTGSGKSAIIQHIIDTEEHVVQISPEALSLTYVSNSDIIQYLENLGTKLDIFYQLLWRHVLCVELLRARYQITSEHDAKTLAAFFFEKFRTDPKKEAAFKYLSRYGSSFWLETEHRVKEVTNTLETELSAGAGLKAGPFTVGIKAGDKITEEQKNEIVHKAQKVVNSVQMQQLHALLKLLDEDVFDDEQKIYYVVIDRLDENWVDDGTRYKLVRALIEAIKTFRTIQNVRIVIALRNDLLERVFERTRDSGFQAEKYEALLLRLNWTREQLKELIELRLNHLLKDQYTTEDISFAKLFPNKLRNTFAFDYMIERTFMRPRDVISFVNECLEKVQGKVEITAKIVHSAEVTYSRKRFDALRDEWNVDHPLLPLYCSVRKRKHSQFCFDDIDPDEIDALALALASDPECERDALARTAARSLDGNFDRKAFFSEWIRTLYKIGIVGVKYETFLAAHWSYQDTPSLPLGVALDDAQFYVHPMLWQALGVIEAERS